MNPITARKLWLLFAVVVSYGSIYPANFQTPPLDMTAMMQSFLQTCCVTSHSGDVLANILLFFPFGFLGMLAASHSDQSTKPLIASVLFWGVLLALVLQLVQIYLPMRDENLQDVAWNFLGILVGVFVGISARQHMSPSSLGTRKILLIPWILIGAWLAYRLIPFVPALDFQGIKDSIKPLFLYTELIPKNIAHDTVAWCLIAYFLRHGHRSISFDVYLPLLIMVTFFLEIIIVSNTLSSSNLVGAGLAIVLWWGVLGRVAKCELILAAMLFAMLVYAGLEPFVVRAQTISFHWLPFKGFLGGSMYINSQSICEKSFLYGSLVYMLWRGGFSPVLSTMLAVIGLTMIEFSQTYFIGRHVPEITDSILAVIMALTLFSLKNDTTTPTTNNLSAHPQQPELKHSHRSVTTGQIRKQYFNRNIDLRPDQVKFLNELAEEMDISMSRAARLIVDAVIKETQQHHNLPFEEPDSQISSDIELEPCSVRLRKEQIEWFKTSSQYSVDNLSLIIRNMIDRFIENIDK